MPLSDELMFSTTPQSDPPALLFPSHQSAPPTFPVISKIYSDTSLKTQVKSEFPMSPALTTARCSPSAEVSVLPDSLAFE